MVIISKEFLVVFLIMELIPGSLNLVQINNLISVCNRHYVLNTGLGCSISHYIRLFVDIVLRLDPSH